MNLDQVCDHLKMGGILAYPTETVWGLGVDATCSEAVLKLLKLKQRAATKAMSILVRGPVEAGHWAVVGESVQRLLRVFWPGPVTFVLPLKDERLKTVSGGSDWIGLRCSSHPSIKDLVWAYDNPITTTSANLSGESEAKSSQELQWLPKEVLIWDDPQDPHSEASLGLSSTVVQIEGSECRILREGAVLSSEIQKAARMFL